MEGNYDEFGNYIGPDLDQVGLGDSDDDSSSDEWSSEEQQDAHAPTEPVDASMTDAIVLHEDKQYYPDASDVYPDAETMIQDEDTQPLTEPIVQPIREKHVQIVEEDFPPLAYSKQFLVDLLLNPALIRNVALVGHLHHGKTNLMDVFVQQTHERNWSSKGEVRYTDARLDEQKRGLSIKATPMTLVLPASSGKSYAMNLMDTPGHPNFVDEVAAGMRVCDGVVLVVDAVEGVMCHTDTLVRQALLQRLSLCVVVNKVDRLILELKLPPNDAYYKLRHTLDEVNQCIQRHASELGMDPTPLWVTPKRGNVLFASAQHGWCFSLASFAHTYAQRYPRSNLNADALAPRLWGDVYFHPTTRKFAPKPPGGRAIGTRTFVQFVLQPLYKLYGQVVGEDAHDLKRTLTGLGIRLAAEDYHQDSRPLLKAVMTRFFGRATAFVDMCVKHVPDPRAAARLRVEDAYTGPLTSRIGRALLAADPEGPLMIQVTKLFQTPDGSDFDAFGRVMSGMVRPGTWCRVLGEAYSLEDEEDSSERQLEAVWLGEARYRVPLEEAGPGCWVLLGGVAEGIIKTATVTEEAVRDAHIFHPLRHATLASVKVSVEPLHPSELPKMVDGLRRINKSYPLVTTRVEESGEHTLLGTGELFMDCVMHDLRNLYTEIEVKVSDPYVSFCETVVETSSLKCFAETPNKRNKFTMIAEPLDPGMAGDVEAGRLSLAWEPSRLSTALQERYGWDRLAARSVWAFGPTDTGPNVLLNDTLPTEVDGELLGQVQNSVVQGFKWAVREGPLCEEPIRDVKFKLLGATIAGEPFHRGGGQVIPTVRRVCYSSFLVARPRLMEPIYFVEILSPADTVTAVYKVLARRRGHVTSETPKAGSPMVMLHAYLPVVDSFGFETDLRAHTQGMAFCLSRFDHWERVPGDPLDRSIVLRPLEPSPPPHLAREFMVKTRRRKGLSDDVSINHFFDESMVVEIQDNLGGTL